MLKEIYLLIKYVSNIDYHKLISSDLGITIIPTQAPNQILHFLIQCWNSLPGVQPVLGVELVP